MGGGGGLGWGYVMPCDTFDNVKGDFLYSFQVWKTNIENEFQKNFEFNAFDEKNKFFDIKKCQVYDDNLINDWFYNNNQNKEKLLAGIMKRGNDFQQNNYLHLYDTSKCNSKTIII